jgi:hypothetical protein
MPLPEGRHAEALREAIAADGRAHRALLAGDAEGATVSLREAARRYRESWEAAPPRSFGRLIGMLKAAVLAGDATEEAAYARQQLGTSADSPPACYALALAALAQCDDATAAEAAAGMRAGSPAFVRTAEAIEALARGDREAYGRALGAIVADFETRPEHLTGVPIADTAVMLERLAASRGMAARPSSALVPA